MSRKLHLPIKNRPSWRVDKLLQVKYVRDVKTSGDKETNRTVDSDSGSYPQTALPGAGMECNLTGYFSHLIERVESSDIQNNGKDDDGFFKPTRAVLLQRLHLLRDLHVNVQKSAHAKTMVRSAWKYIVENLPPEWLVLDQNQRQLLKKILA